MGLIPFHALTIMVLKLNWLGQWWITTFHRFMWMWLIIHGLNSALNDLLSRHFCPCFVWRGRLSCIQLIYKQNLGCVHCLRDITSWIMNWNKSLRIMDLNRNLFIFTRHKLSSSLYNISNITSYEKWWAMQNLQCFLSACAHCWTVICVSKLG